jgi:RNA polymerase sigma factor (sigma-70 family)
MTSLTTSLSPRGNDDFQLVQAAISGDQKAYATLMNRYRQSVYHAMFKMVNNRDDAEDLTIEAFGKAFSKLPSYAPHYAFSTWLFRIAINNCIDYIRKKRLKTFSMDDTIKADSDAQFSQNLSNYEPDAEQIMMHEQKIAHVRSLVENLSTKYRSMIELRYYDELSYEEIAQEMKLPLGTVKAQLFRAKEILYQQLLESNSHQFLDVRARREKADMAEAA